MPGGSVDQQVQGETELWGGRTLVEWLPDVVADVVGAFDPLKAILFGSLARGEAGKDSDIDLLVVLKHVAPQEKGRLMGQVRAAIRAPAPIDIFVTDPVEIARRGHLKGSILYPALREGAVVHEHAAA